MELHNGEAGGGQLRSEGPPLLRPGAAVENTWLQSIPASLLPLSRGTRGSEQRERGRGWLKDRCGL